MWGPKIYTLYKARDGVVGKVWSFGVKRRIIICAYLLYLQEFNLGMVCDNLKEMGRCNSKWIKCIMLFREINYFQQVN